MGVQSFSSNINNISLGYKSQKAKNQISSLDLTKNVGTGFKPIVDSPQTGEDLGSALFDGTIGNLVGAFQLYAHYTAGFCSVLEEIVDGLVVLSTASVVLYSKLYNFLSGTDSIDTDAIEQAVTDFTAFDWSGAISDTVDNMDFVEEYSTVDEKYLNYSEKTGEIVGNVAVYTASSLVPGGTIIVGGIQGAGKGAEKAAQNGATYGEMTTAATLYGATSAGTKWLMGGLDGGLIETNIESFGLGAADSYIKSGIDYATYAHHATDDNGNLKYANFEDYFYQSGGAQDVVVGGLSSTFSNTVTYQIGLEGAGGKAVGNATSGTAKETTKRVFDYVTPNPLDGGGISGGYKGNSVINDVPDIAIGINKAF